MLSASRELEFLKFLDNLGQYLRSTREPRKALAFALRESRTFFRADSGCVAVAEAGEPDARLLLTSTRTGQLGSSAHRPLHSPYPSASSQRRDDGAGPAARCGMGRYGVQAAEAGVRPRRRAAPRACHGRGLGSYPAHGSRTDARRTRPHRPKNHGADLIRRISSTRSWRASVRSRTMTTHPRS